MDSPLEDDSNDCAFSPVASEVEKPLETFPVDVVLAWVVADVSCVPSADAVTSWKPPDACFSRRPRAGRLQGGR